MDERKDHLWKVAQEAEERIEDLVKTGVNPMGIDVGTSKVVAARRKGKDVETAAELNAFIPVAYSRFTETILGQNDISYYREGDELIIYGTATEKFANMFNAETRRPMADGLINPRERFAMPVLEAILRKVLPKAKAAGDVMAFSVPAPPEGRGAAGLTFHEATLRQYFEGMGYRAVAINEGLAVIFAELEDQNFTGIGVSCGGGMCNVTLAYLSIPTTMFSIPKGGDSIDSAVGAVVNQHATRVKLLKEESLDLTRAPKDKLDKALHVYYDDLVESLVEALRRSLSSTDKLPRTDRPLTLVLSGGSAKPKGFKDLFERSLKSRSLPLAIGEVRLASDPLTATARGALIAAMYEK
jgi:actin-like ATPase involved in cell morphogenesis